MMRFRRAPKREVIVFVRRRGDGKILVLKRRREHGGFWHPVSGGVEGREKPRHAAMRELREETGLDGVSLVARLGYHYERPIIAADDEGRRSERFDVHCFLGQLDVDAEPILNGEHDAYAWCSATEAASLLRWDNVQQALACLVEGDGRVRFGEQMPRWRLFRH